MMCREVNCQTALPHFFISVALNAGRSINARVVDENIEPAEMLGNLDNDRGNSLTLRKIECPALGDSSCRKNFPDNGRDTVPVAVKNRNFRSFVGKEMGGCPTHSARGAGHECYLAGNRSAQFGQFCHCVVSLSYEVLSSYENLHSRESGSPLFPPQKSCHTELL